MSSTASTSSYRLSLGQSKEKEKDEQLLEWPIYRTTAKATRPFADTKPLWTPRTIGTTLLILVTFFAAISVALIYLTYYTTRLGLDFPGKTSRPTEETQTVPKDERKCIHNVTVINSRLLELRSDLSAFKENMAKNHDPAVHYEIAATVSLSEAPSAPPGFVAFVFGSSRTNLTIAFETPRDFLDNLLLTIRVIKKMTGTPQRFRRQIARKIESSKIAGYFKLSKEQTMQSRRGKHMISFLVAIDFDYTIPHLILHTCNLNRTTCSLAFDNQLRFIDPPIARTYVVTQFEDKDFVVDLSPSAQISDIDLSLQPRCTLQAPRVTFPPNLKLIN
ncbi:hypothetical protein BIW11_09016 [Tropilaelaps mercedesae]|uniref:Uncharacterized protein n=1 Tax=Tropilaelaps mercedesae TaxID=418985 RepID=A0A1V9XLX3_9ACAR|nr:hypothetical protein BIW11_09016 [Tropilaelaps mercedesae]